ncbi:hypothetical protein LTR46_009027 [Exophiala xenobiotica]|nr:hypothetical protein LTR46_009027 [Exophiala xenobiotica]
MYERWSVTYNYEEESEEDSEDSEYNFWDELVHLPYYQVENPSKQMFRVIGLYPSDSEHGGVNRQPMPDNDNTLFARYPGEPETWGSVWDHFSWKRQPTPFISFFNNFETAMRWKDQFIRKGAYEVHIFCYNTKQVRDLLDAHELAKEIEHISMSTFCKMGYMEAIVLGFMSSPSERVNQWL